MVCTFCFVLFSFSEIMELRHLMNVLCTRVYWPVDTRPKLNVHEAFIRRPGSHIKNLCIYVIYVVCSLAIVSSCCDEPLLLVLTQLGDYKKIY